MILCTSDRLTVRHMEASDLDSLYALLSDTEVMKYIEPPYSYADTEKFLRKAGLADTPMIYAVDDKNARFIGYVIYHEYDMAGMEIGWLLKRKEWHKGYAGELTRMLLKEASVSAGYAIIECSPEQEITKQIALKNGFVYRGMADGCDVYRRLFRALPICYIIGAGENYGLDFEPDDDDLVIAVDGGFRFLTEASIHSDLVIGDFDTLHYAPEHPNVIKLNAEKDDTDMRAAVTEGIRRGYEIFHLYCGTGGRLDHTIANLQLLAELAESGRQGFLFDRGCVITAVRNGKVTFSGSAPGYVSVFAHSGKAEGVFLKGLKYELTDAVLTNTWALGVSNEFAAGEACVSVKDGTLLVVFPKEAMSGVQVVTTPAGSTLAERISASGAAGEKCETVLARKHSGKPE